MIVFTMVLVVPVTLQVRCAFAANADGQPVVVSMGDSYSSGEGTEPFYDQDKENKYESPDWLAHRSEKAWPGLLALEGTIQNRRKGNGWYFVASSGAVTGHIRTEEQKKDWSKWNSPFSQETGSQSLPRQSLMLEEHAGEIDYVTLTIGGNDLGFGDIVTTAVTDLDFIHHGGLKNKLRDAVDYFESDLKKGLMDLYDFVHTTAGSQSKVIVAGYPRLFPNQGRGVISAERAQLINAAVNTFDSELGSIIAASGKDYLKFADVRSEFAGHEESYINDVMLGSQSQDLERVKIASDYSVHPNAEGHEAYARAVQRVLDEFQSESGGDLSSGQDVDIESDVAMSLVFDVSGSMDDASAMRGMTKLDSAKRQSSDFVSSVSGEQSGEGGLSVRVGVCSFASSAETNRGLSNNPEDINASIYSLSAGGQTNMYAGLNEGINQLMAEDGPRLMVFLSDGLSNKGGSRSDILSLAQEAANNNIKIYTIGFGSSFDVDESLLQEIAGITGGEYSHEDSANISSATVGLFATMMNARLQAQYDVLNSLVGSVGQGAISDAGTFDITKNGTVQVYLYWPGSVLDMQLTDPDGKEVKDGYTGYAIDTSTIPTSITIQNAKQGTWDMSVYGREVSMDEEPFYAVAAFEEIEEQEPTITGGGGTQDEGMGILLLFVLMLVGGLFGVYALSVRRRRT